MAAMSDAITADTPARKLFPAMTLNLQVPVVKNGVDRQIGTHLMLLAKSDYFRKSSRAKLWAWARMFNCLPQKYTDRALPANAVKLAPSRQIPRGGLLITDMA